MSRRTRTHYLAIYLFRYRFQIQFTELPLANTRVVPVFDLFMTFRVAPCSDAGKNHYANYRFAFTGTFTKSVSLAIFCYKKHVYLAVSLKPGHAVQLPVSNYVNPDVFETICDIKIVRILQALFVQNKCVEVHLSIRLY